MGKTQILEHPRRDSIFNKAQESKQIKKTDVYNGKNNAEKKKDDDSIHHNDIVMIGPPGQGKSTLSKIIVDGSLHGRSASKF